MATKAEFEHAATLASGLVGWLHVAGMANGSDRSYLREDLAPALEAFRTAFTPIHESLTPSCIELIEHGLASLTTTAPRVRVSDVDRDAFERGLALMVNEAKELGHAE